MLEAGIKGRQEVMVTDENSAAAVGSGLLPVFATPAMVALMEKTAWMSVAPYLNDGEGTVGTKLEIAHNEAFSTGSACSLWLLPGAVSVRYGPVRLKKRPSP